MVQDLILEENAFTVHFRMFKNKSIWQQAVSQENFTEIFSLALNDFLLFQIITRPSAANKNFPYHIRTNQVKPFLSLADL